MPSKAGALGLLALLLAAASASAQEAPREIDAGALRLELTWAATDALASESFRLPAEVLTTLSAIPLGESLLVRGFPTAPAERSDIVFERFEPYAPDARVWVVDAIGKREYPRSERIQLLGSSLIGPELRLGLSLDPDGDSVSGVVSSARGIYTVWQLPTTQPGYPSLEIGTSFEKRFGVETQSSCGVEDQPMIDLPGPRPPGDRVPVIGSSHTHEAVIAFDTDGEFVGDYASTAAANNAIADFITSVNVIYERDLGLRLLKGETVLRTNAGSDPYDSSNTRTQLDEVGNWWAANQGSIDRVWVALLSGKGSSNGGSCSGAGIAWVNSYCENQSHGGSYSATQVLRCVPLNGSSNTNLLGHEVGHNAGSSHTHCYSPTVDQCYNAESGCYTGTPSCPDHTSEIPGIIAGRGTIMSYCHFSAPNGAGCGQTQPFFHPAVTNNITQRITANTPSCVGLAGTDLAVSKSDSDDPVGRRTGLTYTVTVDNLGPGLATDVEVVETLPAGVTFDSTSGCAEDPAGVPTCSLGDLANGESAQYTVTVYVEPAASALSNSVTVSASTSDPVTGNDTALEATAVVDWPCQVGNFDLTAADNAAAGPFVTEGTITAGSGYTVANGETILFRAVGDMLFENDFSITGTFAAVQDSLISCPP